MKRTRFIAIALAVLIAVAFVSCDGDNATPPSVSTNGIGL